MLQRFFLPREVLAQPSASGQGSAWVWDLCRLGVSAGSSSQQHPALQQCHPAHPHTGGLLSFLET